MSDSVTLWTVARQAPLSIGFSRQEYWSGSPFSPPRDLPDPGIQPTSLMSLALTGGFFTTSATTWMPYLHALNLDGLSRYLLPSWKKILLYLLFSIQLSFYLSPVEGIFLKWSLKFPPLGVLILHDH